MKQKQHKMLIFATYKTDIAYLCGGSRSEVLKLRSAAALGPEAETSGKSLLPQPGESCWPGT